MDLYLARTRLKYRLQDLSELTGIHFTILSMLENGRRKPTPIQAHRLKLALGENIIFPMEDTMFKNVPEMPKPVWTKDGRPDFKTLDANPKSAIDHIPDQLVKLLAPLHAMDASKGEYFSFVELKDNYCVCRFELAGGFKVYRANFTVDGDGKVSLQGKPTEIKPTQEQLTALSRKHSVPDAPAPRWTEEGKPDFSNLDK